MSESRFENKLCPVCRKRFGKDDEIVVCPECGTPHHRACWNSLNHCGVEEFHGMNYVWNGRLPDEDEPVKSETEEFAEHVMNVAQSVKEAENDPHHAEYPNIHPNNTENQIFNMIDDPIIDELVKSIQNNEKGADGVSMRELAAFSATSVWHYARAFGAFRDGKKRKVFFNFCSGFFAPLFQFYRKMDWLGILTTILMVVPTIAAIKLAGGAAVQVSDNASNMLLLVNIVIEALWCLFGDYIYYRHAVKRILKIRANYEGDTESDEYFMALYESGKPSFARVVLGFLGIWLIEACVELMLK